MQDNSRPNVLTTTPKMLQINCEIDLAEMCNLHCGYCSHNSSYFTNKDPIYEVEHFEHDIGVLKKLIRWDTLHIMGGESLLNKDLLKYLQITKDAEICEFLNIITNGTLIREVDERIYPLLNGMTVSIYPSTTPEIQQKVRDNADWLKKTFPHMLVTVHVTPWFFKMNCVEKNENPELVHKIFKGCYRNQQNDFSMFNGRMYRCFMSRKIYNFLDKHRHVTKGDFEYLKAQTHDSIPITEDMKLDDVVAFLNQQDTPLEACKWCLGCSGKRHGHTQLKPGDIDYGLLEDIDLDGGAKFLKHYIHRRCELENVRFIKDLNEGKC